MGAKRVKACSDSQLVTQQLGGHCEIKEERMKSYVDRVRELGNQFSQMTVEQIARTENQRADFLAKIESSLIDCRERTITVLGVGIGEQVLAISDDPEDWRLPFIQLLEGMKSEAKREKEILERRARLYYLVNGASYRKMVLPVDAKFFSITEGILVLREAHEGGCAEHIGFGSLARKVARAGFYWPTMRNDAEEMVKKCPSCQKHGWKPNPSPRAVKDIFCVLGRTKRRSSSPLQSL